MLLDDLDSRYRGDYIGQLIDGHHSILAEVQRITSKPDSIAAVIIPELVPKKWWHALLHNQRPLYIKRLLLFEPRVILSSVPYQIS